MNFPDKVRSMKNYEIIEAMCNGLEKEHVRVNMEKFGEVRGGVCYGCAATNTICEITGITFTPETIFFHERCRAVSNDFEFVARFEMAIDFLRTGDIGPYNTVADKIGIATIPESEKLLPHLRTESYREELPAYRAFAKELHDSQAP